MGPRRSAIDALPDSAAGIGGGVGSSGCLINYIRVPRRDGNALDEVGRQIRQVTADETPRVTVIVAAIHPPNVGSAVKATRTVRDDLFEPATAIAIDLLKISRNSRVS